MPEQVSEEAVAGSLTITNARAILAEEVLDRATVRIDDGRITLVEAGGLSSVTGQARVVEAAGAYLMPGVVDLHNDNLELEINPRARANFPVPFALQTMERRLAAAGVTSEFHAIFYLERASNDRSLDAARERAEFILSLAPQARPVRHHILHRLDVHTPRAIDVARDPLRRSAPRLVSLNDHTLGQGQYRNVDRAMSIAAAVAASRGGVQPLILDQLRRMEEVPAADTAVPAFYQRVRALRDELPLVIATHDDDSAAKVDAQVAIGATIAEFPITISAAERARERGMAIVVGAPNLFRGSSQSGNLAARDLVERGLADIICADYHAPCLIPAAFASVAAGLLNLPAAVRMITLHPARAAGLTDRGRIAPGLLADLALVRVGNDGMPQVEATYLAGRQVFAFAGAPVPVAS